MKHPTPEDLLLARWGEGNTDEIRRHLEACAACRERDAENAAVLRATDDSGVSHVPEPPEAFEKVLWELVSPRLKEPEPETRVLPFPLRRLVAPFSIAALLLLAFLLGRFGPRDEAPTADRVSERVFLIAVSDHLERSQLLLVELTNANAPERQELDVTTEKERAGDLLLSNRLYRQAAARSGDPMLQTVLDDLERILLDFSRGPSRLTEPELDSIRRRIESQGVLFKVRVLETRVKQQERTEERNRT